LVGIVRRRSRDAREHVLLEIDALGSGHAEHLDEIQVTLGASRKLFDGSYVEGFHARPNYDVSADGQRFIMVEGGLGLTQGRLDVHLNFGGELERALPRRE